jgi:hypothetical protein
MGNSEDMNDASLHYLPPTGNLKASIAPRMAETVLRPPERFAANEDYLIYSDVTGAKQLRSPTDPVNPYAEGTDDYKFLFSYGTRRSGPIVWDLQMVGGRRNNPNLPGMYRRGYGRRGWFGNRHGSGGIGKKDGGSANKLSTILARELTEKIFPLYTNNPRSTWGQADHLENNGGLYQANLARKVLKLFYGSFNGSNGYPVINPNPDVVLSRLRSALNRIGGGTKMTTHHQSIMVFRPPSYQAGLVGLSCVDTTRPWTKKGDHQYYRLQDYGFRLKTTEGEDLNTIAYRDRDKLRVLDFLVPHVDKDGLLTGYVDGFIVVAWRAVQEPANYQGHYYEALIDVQDHEPEIEDAWPVRLTAVTQSVGSQTFDSKDNKDENVTHTDGVGGLLSRIDSCVYASAKGEIVGREDLEEEITDWEPSEGAVMGANQQYNYSNVLAEIKYGDEGQAPFRFFNKVELDHHYNAKLYGAFKPGLVHRINASKKMLTPTDFDQQGNIRSQGSEDKRTVDGERLNYSNWAKGMMPRFREPAQPVVHTVYNPNVENVYITLGINQLKDTLHKEVEPNELKNNPEEDARKLSPASTYPSLLVIRVAWGTMNPDDPEGSKNEEGNKIYKFVALINGRTLVDLGNPATNKGDYKWVRNDWDSYGNSMNVPIELPAAQRYEAGDGDERNVLTNRYVEITKESCETNSVLLHRDVDLVKVTEVIPVNLTYPFSAIVGTKIDSRSIDNPPARGFDCKLKKVKVPSNYRYEGDNGFDKRYWKSEKEFNEADTELKRVYQGDWDGTFSEELQWTDNPAWILYDLLTSKRYGLGQHIDEDSINKWQLYRIGRFCDAVNDEGIFEGCSDGHGGYEPRFTCNIMFSEGEKIYDAINTIVNLFRGSVFFGSNEISFVDDRPRSPVNLITNENVKDGQFAYSNHNRDEVYNTIEVSYNDRFHNYLPKVEVVENEDDIKDRGVFKTRIEGVGLTSRAMARRAGLHHMVHKISENQTVAFRASLPTLLCHPGDLVVIEDELKTNIQNFGKILSVDPAAQEIRISNTFVDSTMTGRLTVYDPTGVDTIAEVTDIAQRSRKRKYNEFVVEGDLNPSSTLWANNYTGAYNFSGYTQGYPTGEVFQASSAEKFEQYALYTGTGNNMLSFDTAATGWVFSTGTATGAYSFIGSDTGRLTLPDLVYNRMNDYDGGIEYRRGGTTFNLDEYSSFVGGVGILTEAITQGIMASEIDVVSPSQTTVINLTGSPNPIIQDYGTLISGVLETDVLSRLKVGSPCKFEIKNASPFIYKIVDIKEEAPNEYLVTASKYETGKYNLIEKNVSIEHLPQTYSYQVGQTINGVTYESLSAPTGLTAITGDGGLDGNYISGSWFDPAANGSNSTGYLAVLEGQGGVEMVAPVEAYTHPTTQPFTVGFTNLDFVGKYSLKVKCLGNAGAAGYEQNAYYDSNFSQIPVLLIPQLGTPLGESMVKTFVINNDNDV